MWGLSVHKVGNVVATSFKTKTRVRVRFSVAESAYFVSLK